MTIDAWRKSSVLAAFLLTMGALAACEEEGPAEQAGEAVEEGGEAVEEGAEEAQD